MFGASFFGSTYFGDTYFGPQSDDGYAALYRSRRGRWLAISRAAAAMLALFLIG